MSDKNYFKENYIIKGIINCQTGLHIGGSNNNVNIGGTDNEIIRDAISNLPYIPGSSLKGKLRHLLELHEKNSLISVLNNEGEVSTDKHCQAVQIFGVSAAEDKDTILEYPTRIIVRDSFPTQDTIKLWEDNEDIIKGSELKYENNINRLDSSANPRNMERVPKGSKFNFEIIFTVYEEDNKDNLKGVFEAMTLLEDNYLGGSGSRGFGKIKFQNMSLIKRDVNYYKEDANEEKIIEDADLNALKNSI